MRDLQKQIIKELGVKPVIDPEREVEERISFLVEYARTLPSFAGFVLGISGGQDSTLAGKLVQQAVKKMRETIGSNVKFIAVRLPYKKQFDKADASAAIDFIDPDIEHVVQISEGVDGLVSEINNKTDKNISDFNKGNIKARMRMIAQYAIAGDRNMLVVGSDHAAEAVTGFYTKFGDGAADIMPLAGLTKSQGAKILEFLGAPEHLWQKVPTADLLDDKPGESDEQALGVSYDEIDLYLTGDKISLDSAINIEQKYTRSMHKRKLPAKPGDDWWKNE